MTESTHSTMDYHKIAQEVKNNKEPIVVGKVFENGYLQKHGDHYHFVYGKVPEGAIFEDEAPSIVTDDYQFNPQDIVSENDMGYVVRHGDHYHFIYKKDAPTNKIHHGHENVYEHGDHYVFNPNDIVSETDSGYVVKHGDHYHFVFKDKQFHDSLAHESGHAHHDAHDISIIHKDDILEETADGYVIKHDDHYHYVLKKDLPHPIVDEGDNHATKPHHEYELHHETEAESDEVADTSAQSLAAKKAYVAKIYGVDVNTIRVTDEFFIFNDPGHDYDPTHIHPYAVRIHSLVIPEVTGIPEIDFENELLALSKRINQAPHTILVDNNRFVLNHGSHNHYVFIQETDGIKPYYDNQLPAIKGDYVSGEFSKEAVIHKVETLRQMAKDKFKEDPLAYRRIERTLEAFVSDLQFVSNSTLGYISMLEVFRETHIDATEKTDVATVSSVYTELVDTLKTLNVEKYNFTKQELLNELKSAVDKNDKDALDRVSVTVKELKRMAELPSAMVSEMAYMDYFLKHLENETLTLEQREEMASLILEVFKTTTRHKERQFTFYELAPRLISAKATILHQKAQNTAQEVEIGEHYVTLHTEKSSPRVPKPYRLEISDLVNDMRTFIIDLNMATPEVLNEGFKDPILMTPIGPTAVGVASNALEESSPQPEEEPITDDEKTEGDESVAEDADSQEDSATENESSVSNKDETPETAASDTLEDNALHEAEQPQN